MKKRIPMIALLLTPYIWLGSFYITEGAGYMPAVWVIFCVLIFLPNMIYAFVLPRIGYTEGQLFFWNMMLKICNIPIYCIILLAGVVMTAFILPIPFLPVLVFFDYSLLLPSTMYGISGLWRAYRAHTISITTLVVHIIMQFMFCLDVCSSIYLYVSMKRAKKVKASDIIEIHRNEGENEYGKNDTKQKTEKRSLRETCIRVVILLVGLTIAHLGVTLFLLADLGADPFNVLVQGTFRTIQGITGWKMLTHGYTHVAISILIIIVLLVVDRSYIKIGTLLCMVCGGPIIDFFTALLSFFFETERAFIVKLVVLAIGCIILAFGMTIVMKSDAGVGPNDLVAVVLSDKSKKKFSIVRIIVDVSFVVVGFLLGGSVGIGTIVCACLVGPVAGFFLPYNENMVAFVLKKTT